MLKTKIKYQDEFYFNAENLNLNSKKLLNSDKFEFIATENSFSVELIDFYTEKNDLSDLFLSFGVFSSDSRNSKIVVLNLYDEDFHSDIKINDAKIRIKFLGGSNYNTTNNLCYYADKDISKWINDKCSIEKEDNFSCICDASLIYNGLILSFFDDRSNGQQQENEEHWPIYANAGIQFICFLLTIIFFWRQKRNYFSDTIIPSSSCKDLEQQEHEIPDDSFKININAPKSSPCGSNNIETINRETSFWTKLIKYLQFLSFSKTFIKLFIPSQENNYSKFNYSLTITLVTLSDMLFISLLSQNEENSNSINANQLFNDFCKFNISAFLISACLKLIFNKFYKCFNFKKIILVVMILSCFALSSLNILFIIENNKNLGRRLSILYILAFLFEIYFNEIIAYLIYSLISKVIKGIAYRITIARKDKIILSE